MVGKTVFFLTVGQSYMVSTKSVLHWMTNGINQIFSVVVTS